MTIAAALHAYLLSVTEIAAAIGDRLYPERASQDTQTPYAVFHVEIRPAEETLNNIPLLEAAFEVTTISRDYDEVLSVAELTRVALAYFKGLMGGTSGLQVSGLYFDSITPGYSPDLDQFYSTSRYTIHYLPQ